MPKEALPIPVPRKRATITDEEMKNLLRLGRKHRALSVKIKQLDLLAEEIKLTMARTAAKHGLEAVDLPTGNLHYHPPGESKKLSKTKLIEFGVEPELIVRATVKTPKKAYWAISAPGQEKGKSEGEE